LRQGGGEGLPLRGNEPHDSEEFIAKSAERWISAQISAAHWREGQRVPE